MYKSYLLPELLYMSGNFGFSIDKVGFITMFNNLAPYGYARVHHQSHDMRDLSHVPCLSQLNGVGHRVTSRDIGRIWVVPTF
jgi:hypothetical protein